MRQVNEKRLDYAAFNTVYPLLVALTRDGKDDLVHELITDEKYWLNIIREGGTRTFEGWGKERKWNTSLYHLTLSVGAIFLADLLIKDLFLPE